MKQIRNLAICLAIVGVGLPATADVKSIHGSVCQPYGGFDKSDLSYNAVTGVVADTNVEVVCPLLRDRINSATSLSSVVVEVNNYTSSGNNFDCTLYAQTEDSGGSYVDTDNQTTSTSGATQMTFNVTSTNGNEGTYGLLCEMGTFDTIHHIHINEDNSATD
jgi:hypothetical protein